MSLFDPFSHNPTSSSTNIHAQSHNSSRQGSSHLTTKTPKLVVVGAPLNPKPSTTQFLLSFSRYQPRFLQFIAKPSESLLLNYSDTDSSFPSFRRYVPQTRCTTGRYQSSSFSCSRLSKLRTFSTFIFGPCYILLHIFAGSQSCYQEIGSLARPKPLNLELSGTYSSQHGKVGGKNKRGIPPQKPQLGICWNPPAI